MTEKDIKSLAIICDHACPGRHSRDFYRWADLVSNIADLISKSEPTFDRHMFFSVACSYQRDAAREHNGFYTYPSRVRFVKGEAKPWDT